MNNDVRRRGVHHKLDIRRSCVSSGLVGADDLGERREIGSCLAPMTRLYASCSQVAEQDARELVNGDSHTRHARPSPGADCRALRFALRLVRCWRHVMLIAPPPSADRLALWARQQWPRTELSG